MAAWEFDGGPPLQQSFSTSTTGPTWSGMMVTSGTIKVKNTTDGSSGSYPITVLRRTNGWRWTQAQWIFHSDISAHPCDSEGIHHRFQIDARAGRNTNAPGGVAQDCNERGPLLPFPHLSDGWGRASVQDNGPNRGLWYVTRSDHKMERGSVLNPDVKLTGKAWPIPPSDSTSCAGKSMNWYNYNNTCSGQGSMPSATVLSLFLAHEGRGPAGHQTRKEQKAAMPDGDPRFAIEDVVYTSEASLQNAVVGRLMAVNNALQTYSADNQPHVGKGGNGTAVFWIWNPASASFVLVTQGV